MKTKKITDAIKDQNYRSVDHNKPHAKGPQYIIDKQSILIA